MFLRGIEGFPGGCGDHQGWHIGSFDASGQDKKCSLYVLSVGGLALTTHFEK